MVAPISLAQAWFYRAQKDQHAPTGLRIPLSFKDSLGDRVKIASNCLGLRVSMQAQLRAEWIEWTIASGLASLPARAVLVARPGLSDQAGVRRS